MFDEPPTPLTKKSKCVIRMAHIPKRIRELCRSLVANPNQDATDLMTTVSESLNAVRTVIEERALDIIQGMNAKVWANERHVLLFLLTTEKAIPKALRHVPPLLLLPLGFIEAQYKGFEAHLVLVRAVLASGQHAPYLIVLELPVLAPTKFADTYVISGTFALPHSWNRPGPVLDVKRLAIDIAKAGGTAEDCEMVAPLEPAATANDREISLGEDVDVIAAALGIHECAQCDTTARKLRKCAGCLVARYCSPEHQEAHWPVHKLQCRKLADWYSLRDTPVS